MTRFLAHRLLQALVVMLLVCLITFVLLQLLPGGEARAALGSRASPAQIRQFDRANGLDRPIYVQFGVWLSHLLHGNLGYSYHLNQSVASLIAEKLPKTLVLNALALFFSVMVAIPIGIT